MQRPPHHRLAFGLRRRSPARLSAALPPPLSGICKPLFARGKQFEAGEGNVWGPMRRVQWEEWGILLPLLGTAFRRLY